MTNLECRKILLVESGIPGFGMRNTSQGIRNPTNDWNWFQNPTSPEKNWDAVPGIRSPRCGFPSLRTADVFPVVASLPPQNRRERSDDRKCVCCSQAVDFLKWADLDVKFCLFKEQLGFKKLSGRFTTMEKSTANELKTVFHS